MIAFSNLFVSTKVWEAVTITMESKVSPDSKLQIKGRERSIGIAVSWKENSFFKFKVIEEKLFPTDKFLYYKLL